MAKAFKRRHGVVILCDEEGYILTSYHELAFCFDKASGTVHNYGEADRVQEWYEESKVSYVAAGYPELALNLTIVSAEGHLWNLRDINKFIHTPGALHEWYRQWFPGGLSDPVVLRNVSDIKDAELA